jgi:hypothetical protein
VFPIDKDPQKDRRSAAAIGPYCGQKLSSRADRTGDAALGLVIRLNKLTQAKEFNSPNLVKYARCPVQQAPGKRARDGWGQGHYFSKIWLYACDMDCCARLSDGRLTLRV